MVQLTVEDGAAGDQNIALVGFASVLFDLEATVQDLTPTGFTLLPGTGETFDYIGRNLTFEDITIARHTLSAPETGVITAMRETGADYTITLSDFSLDAAAFFAVSATPGDDDNRDLLKQIFSTRDRLKGSSGMDEFNGFGGNDVVLGRHGDDRLSGGRGLDKLVGGWGDDVIDGGRGNDVMRGNRGDDIFVFRGRDAGSDTIRDFGHGADMIRIRASGVSEFADLTITYDGDDALVTYGKTAITLLDVGPGALGEGDFLL